jgi:hypothetical protein
MADGAKTYHRSIRNYLLNLRYQLRFTLPIVIISAVLTGGLGYIVMSKAHEATRNQQEASRVVQVRAMDPTDELAQQLTVQFARNDATFERNDRVMKAVLIGFGVLLCVVLTFYGIIVSHKVAGPLYKVTLYLDKIRDGKLGVVYNLRKGDELVDFFEHFKTAHDALRQRTMDDIAMIDKAIAALSAVDSGPLVEELRAVRSAKQASLE